MIFCGKSRELWRLWEKSKRFWGVLCMSKEFPMVPLRELLIKSENWIAIHPDEQYQQVTVRLWGKGVVARDKVNGADMGATRRLIVRPNQFILSRIDARNGATGLVPDSLDGAIVSSDFPVFTVNRLRLLPNFLEWMSKTQNFVSLCKAASEGTTNRIRLQEETFLSMSIPLPQIEEQQRIVARIEELAAKIEEARGLRGEIVGEIEKLVRTSTAKVFEDAYKNGTTRLDNVATLERGKFSHRPRNDPQFFDGKHPWIQIAEIEASNKYIHRWNQTLNDTGLAISRKFPKGTLLISIAATIGAIGILDFDCCIPDSIVAITPKIGTDSEYLYYYLGYLRNHLEQIAPQSAQKNINLEILFPLPIPELDITEQRRIVAYLDALQARVDALKQLQSETSAELYSMLSSLLPNATLFAFSTPA